MPSVLTNCFVFQMSLALEEEAGNIIAMETMAVERQEISRMVKCRMSSLGLPLDDYSEYLVTSVGPLISIKNTH